MGKKNHLFVNLGIFGFFEHLKVVALSSGEMERMFCIVIDPLIVKNTLRIN